MDSGRVYTLSRWGDAFCFDAASGKVIWSKNVHKETGIRIPAWGYSGSPLVQENLVVLNMGEAGIALDKTTGELLWKSANKDAGYSTPLPIKQEDTWLALIGSAQAYVAVNLATGREAWRVRWLTQYGVNAADPIISGEQLFIATGYDKGCALLKMGAGEPASLWKSKALRTQMNPAVLSGTCIYGIDGDAANGATLKCIDWSTGAEKWAESGIGSGALTAAGGKLIVLSERGELLVAPVSSEAFKPTAHAQVLGGKCWTVPVLANGRIYCRNSRGDLICVDVRKS